MKYLIDKIIEQQTFSEKEAYEFIYAIEKDSLTQEQISGILVGIQMRGVQLEEIKGFRKALLELSVVPKLDAEHAIDLCGTGGDGKNTFNISTTSALVLAAMGKRVIKHGNYGVSSNCGSSNVLEALGYKFTKDEGQLSKHLDETNICFLHAPLFHPTMKKVAPVRKALGIRTIFNILGPLVNPTQPKYQLTGTYSLELAKLYQHVLKDERSDFRIVYGMDGFDEISLTDSTRVLGKHTEHVVDHNTFDQEKVKLASLKSGKSISDAATIIKSILNGRGTVEQNAVTAANVATALTIYDPTKSINSHFELAFDFIQSGKGKQQLNFN